MSDPNHMLPAVPDHYAALIEGLFDEFDDVASENEDIYMSRQSPFERWQGLFNEIRRGNQTVLNLICSTPGGNDCGHHYDVRNRELIQSVKMGLMEALESPNARMVVKLSMGQALLSQLTIPEQKRLFRAVFQRDMPQRYEINIGSYDLLDDNSSMENNNNTNGSSEEDHHHHHHHDIIPSSFQSAIDTTSLTDAMRGAQPTIAFLRLQHIHFSSMHQVFKLADCIEQSKDTLELIDLRHLSFDEAVLRPMNSPIGQASRVLDRVFCSVCKAGRNLKFFSISGPKQQQSAPTTTRRISNPLVSPEMLRLLFLCQRDWDELWLRHLGLEDDHCRQIAEGIKAEELCLKELPSELVTILETMPADDIAKAKEASLRFINEEKTSFRVVRISLNDNPAITDVGYQEIFRFIDERKVQGLEWVSVQNNVWESKMHLVMKMNSYLGRREFMTKGGRFRDKKSCIRFLERINNNNNSEEEEEGGGCDDDDGILLLDFLYFTLRENPEFIASKVVENGNKISEPHCKKIRLGW